MTASLRRVLAVLLAVQLASLAIRPIASARIMVAPMPWASHAFDLAKLSTELMRRGHEVMLITPAVFTPRLQVILEAADLPAGADGLLLSLKALNLSPAADQAMHILSGIFPWEIIGLAPQLDQQRHNSSNALQRCVDRAVSPTLTSSRCPGAQRVMHRC